MTKPKPSQEGGDAVELEELEDDDDEAKYDDEAPLFDPEESGK